MKKIQIEKHALLFIIGFVIYLSIEIIATALDHTINKQFQAATQYFSLIGFSSVWMGFIGGFIFVVVAKLLELKIMTKHMLFITCLIGMILIDIFELTSGLILNVLLKFNIWNYGGINLLGQIDLVHSICWFFLTPFVIWLKDFIEYALYDGSKSYSLLWLYLNLFIKVKPNFSKYPYYRLKRFHENNPVKSFVGYARKVKNEKA